MTAPLLVDTDILIDAARADDKAIAFLGKKERDHELSISTVTQMELIVGCRNKRELAELGKSLKRFVIIPLSDVSSARAADLLKEFRLSHGLLIPDALIAATALAHNLELATKNRRDFRFIPGLHLVHYP